MSQRDPMLERPLPSSPETERAILGSIILDNSLIAQAIEILKPSDFYVNGHRRIFVAMVVLFETSSEINPILIAEELRRDNSLDSVGGMLFLTNLTYGVPHVNSVKEFAKVVRGKSMLRQLVKVASKITSECLEEEDDPETIFENAEQAIFSLAEERVRGGQVVVSVKDLVPLTRTRLESFHPDENTDPSIPTPWNQINNLCRGGIQETELWAVAALMKAGKSAWLKQWAQFLVMKGKRVLIFSREMSEMKIFFRMLSPIANVPTGHIKHGLDEHRIFDLIKATYELENTGLFFDTKTSNIDEFRTRVREMIRLEKIDIVFADYLQLFKSGKRNASRADDVGYVWRTMKDTAQDFETRVVTLAQFNRSAFQSNERPYFHQVEGSGEGEKAVDVGMVLWTQMNKGEPGARPATVFIDYQRDEDAGTKAELIFDGRIMEFHEDYGGSHEQRY